MAQPLRHDRQVFVLAERIEADPQAEALGQRDLLLDRLAGMDLAMLAVGTAEVVGHLLGQQMAAVAGGVDQQVVGGRGDRAIEHTLERLVAGFTVVEAQVVAEHDETLGPARHLLDKVGQIDQIGLVDLDQPQALAGELVEHRLDQRALAGALGAGQQDIVGRTAGDELGRVAQQALFLRLDLLEIGQPDARDLGHRLDAKAAVTAPGAKRRRRGPVSRRRSRRQHRFQPAQQGLGAGDQ
mmetsp:Transcript_71390/g.168262  ORF Transcript_71390/g.168262 Transcript_71390/m.168262 type:complete len:240 (-) Transcript_71390:255-974(-)